MPDAPAPTPQKAETLEQARRAGGMSPFDDPAFLAAADAALKNSEALRKGETPTADTTIKDGDAAPPPGGDAKGGAKSEGAEGEGDGAPAEGDDSPHPSDMLKPPSKITSSNWKALKASHKRETDELRLKIASLEKALATASGDAAIEALRAENETLRTELRAVAIERDPAFRKEWKERESAAIERLKLIAPKLADKLAKIALMPVDDEQQRLMDDLLKDLPAWQQARIGAAMQDVFKLHADKEALIAKARAEQEQRALVSEQRKLAEQARIKAAFDEELSDWEEALATVKDKAAVDLAVKRARAFYNGEIDDYREIARFAMEGGTAELLRRNNLAKDQQIEELRSENAQLRDHIAKLTGIQPAPGVGSAGSQSDADDEDGYVKHGGFGAAVAAAAHRAGLLIK